MGSGPAAAVYEPVQPHAGISTGEGDVGFRRVCGEQGNASDCAARGKSAVAGDGTVQHVGTAERPPSTGEGTAERGQHSADRIERDEQLQLAADDGAAPDGRRAGVDFQLYVLQDADGQSGLLRMRWGELRRRLLAERL